jgi:hypothetical protein
LEPIRDKIAAVMTVRSRRRFVVCLSMTPPVQNLRCLVSFGEKAEARRRACQVCFEGVSVLLQHDDGVA